MLGVLTREGKGRKRKNNERHKEIFEGDGCVSYLRCGYSYTSTYVCSNSPTYLYNNYVHLYSYYIPQ